MSPRSRSRSISPRRSYTKSPVRRDNGRRFLNRRHSREKVYSSRSRSASRQPPSPPPLPSGRGGRYSEASQSSSTSLSPRHGRRISRSRSRSTYEKRRGNREKPVQNRCIGVFGLSVYTTQQKIRDIFSRFGPIERIQVVIDAQTGRSRGFCFIYYEDIADAKAAKDACSGMEIDDRRIRVDYSTTQRPHTPTPGVYMGRQTRREREHSDRYRDDYRPRRRSGSPYHSRNNNYRSDRRRRYERSRSRSYSPRRARY
ncbi:transformer-2 sex-determining protein isoform X1 [Bactrocera dorsalis]|uniref:Transformer-2 sex-determining protein isoform X1 n=1 Tax=Bactrocera dorsalis TaxID=27457 RepID=A0A6I9V585_BACDO|nr:transformer-2 sex-determining protein isoform X1 [Bactrocera dorsalis]